jgi:hypothetical protein
MSDQDPPWSDHHRRLANSPSGPAARTHRRPGGSHRPPPPPSSLIALRHARRHVQPRKRPVGRPTLGRPTCVWFRRPSIRPGTTGYPRAPERKVSWPARESWNPCDSYVQYDKCSAQPGKRHLARRKRRVEHDNRCRVTPTRHVEAHASRLWDRRYGSRIHLQPRARLRAPPARVTWYPSGRKRRYSLRDRHDNDAHTGHESRWLV